MKGFGGLITYALAQYGSEPGKVQELSVTENGEYTAPKGYVGFNPILVNVDVTPKIQELSVSEPGTYYAKTYGCDGFDPVIVSDKYKKLYEQAKGLGENIDTGITDPDGNEIILDNAVETDWDIIKFITIREGSTTITCPETGVQLKLYVRYSDPYTLTDGKSYVTKYLGATLSNLKTGQTQTYDNVLRGGYEMLVSQTALCWFTIENYEITFNGQFLQFTPGRVWWNGKLWGGDENWWNGFYPQFNSGLVGTYVGFQSPVYFQAAYS